MTIEELVCKLTDPLIISSYSMGDIFKFMYKIVFKTEYNPKKHIVKSNWFFTFRNYIMVEVNNSSNERSDTECEMINSFIQLFQNYRSLFPYMSQIAKEIKILCPQASNKNINIPMDMDKYIYEFSEGNLGLLYNICCLVCGTDIGGILY